MQDATVVERIRQKCASVSPVMDERMRRQWAAAEASSVGWGEITCVAAATGLEANEGAGNHWSQKDAITTVPGTFVSWHLCVLSTV
jgi:hypothetical protein